MGYISVSVLTSFTLLVAYSILISAADARTTEDLATLATNELLHKRPAPAVWLKQYPIRKLKPINFYSVYRRDSQPTEVEFQDDVVNGIQKRFDDYGHMR